MHKVRSYGEPVAIFRRGFWTYQNILMVENMPTTTVTGAAALTGTGTLTGSGLEV